MKARTVRYSAAVMAAALAAAVGFGVAIAQARPGNIQLHHQAIVEPPPASAGSAGLGTTRILADPPSSTGGAGPAQT